MLYSNSSTATAGAAVHRKVQLLSREGAPGAVVLTGDEEGEVHASQVVVHTQGGDSGHHQGSTGGLGEGAKQVGTHASDVTDVVTHVVCSTGSSRGWSAAGQWVVRATTLEKR